MDNILLRFQQLRCVLDWAKAGCPERSEGLWLQRAQRGFDWLLDLGDELGVQGMRHFERRITSFPRWILFYVVIGFVWMYVYVQGALMEDFVE